MSLRFVINQSSPAIILTRKALMTMTRYRQYHANSKEAGGQLFAKFVGADTLIVEATRPKLIDERGSYWFKPNKVAQQLEITEQYKKGLHFVGDWHTHPEEIPTPSRRDKNNMIECFSLSTHQLRAFVMVIVGNSPFPDGIHVSLVESRSITKLEPQAGDKKNYETL